jgi:hypothetical protein
MRIEKSLEALVDRFDPVPGDQRIEPVKISV